MPAPRSLLPALVALLGCGHAGPDVAGPRGGAALPPADVAADVALLAQVLEETYAGRVFNTDETWRSFRRELDGLAAARHRDAAAFCDAVGGALTRLIEPGLFATLGDPAARCLGAGGTSGGYPYASPSAGANRAAAAAAPFVLEVEPGPPSIAVLAVRRFEPPDAPGWEGLAGAVSRAVVAGALIVDLRGAGGDDPSALLPLLAILAPGGDVRPLRAIVRPEGEPSEGLRRAYAARFGDAPGPRPAAWGALVGPEPAPFAPMHEPLVTVLVGPGCQEACELVARALEAQAAATVIGGVESARRLSVGEPGLLVLPRTGVEVHVPTAAYVLHDRFAGRGSLGRGAPGRWHTLGGPHDALERARAAARATLAERARLARWRHADPPPCASLPAHRTLDRLPPEARARIHGEGFLRGGFPVVIAARIDLDADRARAHVDGCPGLEAGSAFGGAPAMVFIRRHTVEGLSRLAQSEAVRWIQIEHDVPMQPGSTKIE